MKDLKNKDFSPDENVEDLYGPPPFDEPEDDIKPEFITERMPQMAYGPPNAMPGMFNPGFKPMPAGMMPPPPMEDRLADCLNSIRARTDFVPKAALILGSGLGDFAETSVDVVTSVDYGSLPGFPRSTVEGHKGRFVFGYVGNVPVVIMQGRVHLYEGYPPADAVMPIRLMKLLGAEILFLTNASGGINAGFSAGDFMLITDHISCFVPNPLIGRNLDTLGTRFPDMSHIYDPELREIITETAMELDIKLQQGVYLQLTGPSFESPAEIRMLRTFGADAVGMSTVIEAIAARHAGMRVCGISCISNLACGMTDQPLTHAEVQECADKAAPKFRALVSGAIAKFEKLL